MRFSKRWISMILIFVLVLSNAAVPAAAMQVTYKTSIEKDVIMAEPSYGHWRGGIIYEYASSYYVQDGMFYLVDPQWTFTKAVWRDGNNMTHNSIDRLTNGKYVIWHAFNASLGDHPTDDQTAEVRTGCSTVMLKSNKFDFMSDLLHDEDVGDWGWSGDKYTLESTSTPEVSYVYQGTVPADAPSYAKKAVTAGTTVTLPRPTAVGYDFSGWSSNDVTISAGAFQMPAQDVTITGSWIAHTNTVSYAYTGAATDVTPPTLPAAATYRYGQSVTLASAPSLPGYNFSGWSLSPALTISGGAFTMPDTAVSITGSWTPRTDTPYTVEYYQQHTDDNGYQLADTEHCTGTTGAAATVPVKMYPGFSETAGSIAGRSGTVIRSDGSTVIKLYFDRSTNTVSYAYTGAATDVTPPTLPAVATYRFGQSVTLASAPTLLGYDFSGWSLSPALTISGGAFTMPDKAVSITGSWTPRTDTPYTVEYYQQHTDDDGYELADTEHCTGTTGTAAAVPDKVYPGFSETAESIAARSGAVIRSDGSTVIKLYFDRSTNTVSYAYTGTATDVTPPVLPTVATYRFGQSVTLTSVPVLPGYDFSGWSLSPALTISGGTFTMPDGPVIVTGSWTPRTDTPYTVEYYQQHTDDDGYELADTEHCIGTTGAAATVPDKMYPGFFETAESITGRSGAVIRSDGSTVIKLYFDRSTNTVSYAYTGTATDVTPPILPAVATYRFGQSVTLASVPSLPGYDFSGWQLTPELEISNGVFVMPDGPVSVTGFWVPCADTSYTVEYYQQHIDDDGYDLAYTFHGVGVTGAGIPHKEFEGFVETPDSVSAEGNAVIRSDGSTVVKLYYDRERYEVAYAYLGTVPQGAAALPAAATYRFGQSVTLASVPSLPGYDFSGWQLTPKPEISNGAFVMPSTAVSITGSWTPRADTPYTVEYYQQHTDDDSYELAYTFHGTGVTGAGIPHKEFEGFIETPDSVAAEGGAVIRNDGSTVVKLYYDRERCEVTYAYLGTVPRGAAALPAAATYRFGQSVTLANVPSLPGYDFSGWQLTPELEISNGAFLMPSTAVAVTGSWTVERKEHDSVSIMDPNEQIRSLEDNSSAYIIGYDDGSFRPNDYLTAQHEALMLSRLGLQTADLTEAEKERYITRREFITTLTDAAGMDADDPMQAAVFNGWLVGYTDGDLRPAAFVTRAQAVVILNRAFGREDIQSSADLYADLPKDYWARDAIIAASVPM